MDIRKIRSFVTVARLGSISATAQAMRMTQPAISQHVKAMEEAFGTQLFERKRKGTMPTEAGHAVLHHMIQLLESYDRAQSGIQDARGEPQGSVCLGLPTTVAATVSAPLIRHIAADYPKICLRITESLSGYLREWIDEGRVDLAVLFEPLDAIESAGEPLLVESLFLVSSASSGPCAEPDTIAAHDLPDVPLVLPGAPHSLRVMIDRYAIQNELDLNIRFELDATVAMRDLVADGEVSTILPLQPIRRDVDEGRLRTQRIVSPELQRRLVFCRSPIHAFTPAFAAVRRSLCARLDQIYSSRHSDAQIMRPRRT